MKCRNPECTNEFATSDSICGATIGSGDDKIICDYINFENHKKICNFDILFSLSSGTVLEVNAGLQNENEGYFDEIFWNSGIRESADFENPSFMKLANAISQSILLCGKLNSDPYRLARAYLEPGESELELHINLELYLLSMPYDWVEYGPEALANDLQNEEILLLEIDNQLEHPKLVTVEY